LSICPEIHGNSGLDTINGTLPDVPLKEPIKEKAIIHMYKIISQSQEPVTILATAALTNIALLITIFPEIKQKIKQIILLGGAMGTGNISPVAEFNILVDPHAAKMIFESGLKIIQIPLEVSHTCLVTDDIIKEIKSWNTPFSVVLIDLLMFFAKTYKEVYGFQDPPLHDPLTVAYAINPDIFETRFLRVDIETNSELSKGQTVCDIHHRTNKQKNVHVAMKVNVSKFWEMLLHSLKIANQQSILNK